MINNQQPILTATDIQRPFFVVVTLLILLALSGCSRLRDMVLAPAAPEQTATQEVRVIIPTFTPTPVQVAAQPTAVVVDAAPAENAQSTESEPTALPEVPTEPPALDPRLLITEELVNVRSGPDTAYPLIATVGQGEEFEIIGKNPDGSWWQICCVSGQEVWVFSQLAQAQDAGAVAVAQLIPPVPTPIPPTLIPPTPVPPTPLPYVPPTALPYVPPTALPYVPPTAIPPTAVPAAPTAPPAAADPCAGIGGDGCKWKVRNGPSTNDNGGGELKMQLAFIHTGVDGGQAQGSYFVGLIKDGQTVGVSDSTRSQALDKRDGPLGKYNYEFSIGASNLPNGKVGGSYEMWVIDGNGERDSRNVQFSVPDGQGLLWVEWDQN